MTLFCSFIFLNIFVCLSCFHLDLNAFDEIQALSGSNIDLICKTKSWLKKTIALIFWYKGSSEVPLYTLDVRNSSLNNSRHILPQTLRSKLFFDVSKNPPKLIIKNVSKSDQDQYRCRVDYKKSRTENFFSNLLVIAPPKSVIIKNKKGEELNGTIGPFKPSSNVTLICEAKEGDPHPSVKWWKDELLIDESYTIENDNTITNELIVVNLNRSNLMNLLTCIASNTHLIPPKKVSISLDLILKPIDVNIENSGMPFVVGRKYKVYCKSSGSRPSAQLTWWLDAKKINQSFSNISEDGNTTLSTLWFSPSVQDNGKYLTCRSCNTYLDDGELEDKLVLDVQFRPKLTLLLGANLDANNIKEGIDVFFECNVLANPKVLELIWFFEDEILLSNVSAGIIVSNQTLVLQKVKRQNIGRYRCSASNSQGNSTSEGIYLKIKFLPTCLSSQKRTYGVAQNELAHIVCEVEASPANVTFKWIFTNSQNITSLFNFVSNKTKSIISYRPRTRFDYGSLLCLAENEVGLQPNACVFNIIAEGPPEPFKSCFSLNETNQSVVIECEPEEYGRLREVYFVEVYNSKHQVVANITSLEKPVFFISNLLPANTYQFKIYAANYKGRSKIFYLKSQTLPNPQKKSAQDSKKVFVNIIMPILIIAITFISIVFITIVKIRLKKTNNYHSNNEAETEFPSHYVFDLNFNLSALEQIEKEQNAKHVNLIKCGVHSNDVKTCVHNLSQLKKIKDNLVPSTKLKNYYSNPIIWPNNIYQLGYVTNVTEID